MASGRGPFPAPSKFLPIESRQDQGRIKASYGYGHGPATVTAMAIYIYGQHKYIYLIYIAIQQAARPLESLIPLEEEEKPSNVQQAIITPQGQDIDTALILLAVVRLASDGFPSKRTPSKRIKIKAGSRPDQGIYLESISRAHKHKPRLDPGLTLDDQASGTLTAQTQ